MIGFYRSSWCVGILVGGGWRWEVLGGGHEAVEVVRSVVERRVNDTSGEPFGKKNMRVNILLLWQVVNYFQRLRMVSFFESCFLDISLREGRDTCW